MIQLFSLMQIMQVMQVMRASPAHLWVDFRVILHQNWYFRPKKKPSIFSQDFSSALSEDPQKILHGGETDGEAAEGGELRLQAEGDGQLPQAEEPAAEHEGGGGDEEGGGEVPAGAAHHLHCRALRRRPQACHQQCQGVGKPKS